MRITSLILLTRLLTLSSPIPLPSSSLTPRTKYCLNAPNIPAGSLLPRAPSPPTFLTFQPGGPYVWCAPSSRTYIITTVLRLIPGNTIQTSLHAIYAGVLTQIHISGDGPLPNGVFVDSNPATKVNFEVANVDNHQTTWGVFGAALTALEECMRFYGTWGEAIFHIYDGGNLVGAGMVGFFERDAFTGGSLATALGDLP